MKMPTAVVAGVDDRVGLSRTHWVRLLSGLVAIFTLFQWIATALHSDRGQAGVIVALTVVSATLIAQRWLYAGTLVETTRSVGLGIPALRGLAAACGSCASLAIVQAAIVMASGGVVTHAPTGLLTVAGLFAQGGVAEETLFRGYLFGDLRRRFPFWRAWFASMIPFVAVHLFLFLTMPWPVATASVFLAVTTSIPLSHLYELGGRTIWSPALLHFTIQSVPKLFISADGAGLTFPLTWMAVCGTLPLLILLIRVRRSPRETVAPVP
jgi:membrane protease YdiL (CAAX protease family)